MGLDMCKGFHQALGVCEAVDTFCRSGFRCNNALVNHLLKFFLSCCSELFWDLSAGMLYRFYAGISSYGIVSVYGGYSVK